MRAIFISYRRDDAEGQAGRLFNDLAHLFGADTVFMDVAGIEPGRDFRRAIDHQVASCSVLLALIGKNWLTAKDESGARRLDDPMDFVRLETASALKRDIPVVPVLVQGATVPRVDDLPEDLKELAFRNAVELTHARWDSDVQTLVKALRPYVQVAQAAPSSPPRFALHEHGTKRVTRLWTGIAGLVGVLLLVGGWHLWRGRASEKRAQGAGTLPQTEGSAPAQVVRARPVNPVPGRASEERERLPDAAPPPQGEGTPSPTEPSAPAQIVPTRRPSVCTNMYADERLHPDQSIKSCDGRFRLLLQHDGNLVLYQGDTPLWASSTIGKASAVAVMQGDGNVVIYDAQARPLWASGTSNHPGAHLAVQNDGNVVIYDSTNGPLWATNTCCH